MDMDRYTELAVTETMKLLAIPSPSGCTDEAIEWCEREFSILGFETKRTVKGGLIVDLGGENDDDGIFLEAHCDTLGAMVSTIKPTGRLELSRIGGMNANNAEGENAVVITRSGKRYEATLQLCNPSIHVNGEYDNISRAWEKMELVIDQDVHTADDVRALGIHIGDYVCFDPRSRVTESGYIKSRFLDDKLSVGILLGLAAYMHDHQIVPKRHVYAHITVFEEVGHGGSASVPAGVTEAISVDMGCVGDGLDCTEHEVSICAKDSGGPYSRSIVLALAKAAEAAGAKYAVDVYPHYGSDVETTLRAGNDIRHGLIGAGVFASHGYERSHRDGVENTLKLLVSYLFGITE